MGIRRPHPFHRIGMSDLQGLFDMKVPEFPVLVPAAVVVDPVGHIGVLLNLRNEKTFSDGMKGP